MQAQNLHAVLKRRRNGLQHVRGSHEEHLRQVVFHVEIVILETRVLLRIQHLEQRRSGISAQVGGHLVHFVQHKDRVLGARFLHGLDDLSGQCSDVGPAMPTDLRLVAYAAQGHTHELAPRSLGDRHAQGSLADARRPNEAKDGALGILYQLADGQKLKNALLDFLQAVVVSVQYLFGMINAARFLAFLLPRHSQQPIQIVSGYSRFRRHGRHRLQLFQLLNRFIEDVLGHACALDLLAQLIELALLTAAQFLLDGLDLLVEVVLFLRALHLPLYPALHAAIHVQLLDFDIQHVCNPRQPLAGVEDIQQFLLLFDRKLQVGGDRIGKLCRLVHAHRGDHGLVIQGLLQLDVLLKEGSDPLHHSFDLRVDFELPVSHAHGSHKKAIGVIHLHGFCPLQAFHQHLDIAVRHLHALDDVADGSHGIDVFRPRLIDACVVLGSEKYLPVSGQRLFQRSHARLAPHNEGRHHVREDHHIPDGHHGELAKIAFVTGFFCLCHAISFHLFPLYRGKGSCANDPDVRASTNQ